MCDNHTHEHEHTHEHGNDHCCCGGEHKEPSAVENMALLNYMIDHNRHHNEDLHELFHSLEAAGKKEAAAVVAEAMHFYDHGTEKLEDALRLLGK